MTFSLNMLPAREGDCMLVSYGEDGQVPSSLLIDGGTSATWADIKARADIRFGADGRFELIVVTHLDSDHIGGMLKLCNDADFQAEVADFWFNGYKHLRPGLEEFGVGQAEKLSDAISARRWPWNEAFDQKAVATLQGQDVPLSVSLKGGMSITILSPSPEGLLALEADWDKWLAKAGIRRGQENDDEAAQAPADDGLEKFGPYETPDLDMLCALPENPDDKRPNGSSIAFLMSFQNKVVLFGADAHAGVLEASLRKMGYSEDNRLALDLLKVPHHGSGRNVSVGLLSILDCDRFAISTNGSHHEHPDDAALARIVRCSVRPKTIYFNYDRLKNTGWNDPVFKKENGFDCVFPGPADDGRLTIVI